MPAPQYTRNQILNQNTNDFPNNNGGLITPAILRDYNANVANSVVFRDEPIDNAVSASFATFALTASYTPNQDGLDSTSFVGTASYNADSSSFSSKINSLTNATSSYITNSQTGSMSVLSASYALTASFAANVPATASYALNALSSSYAGNAELLDGVNSTAFAQLSQNNTFTGVNNFGIISASNAHVVSASIDYLFVVYQTSSVIFSSGSNVFGDNANDTQTLWGTVDIKTGPVLVTGSVNASQGFTGSLSGNASTATSSSYASQSLSSSYAQTASKVSVVDDNGNTNHRVLFTNALVATSDAELLIDANDFTYNPNQNLLSVTASYALQALSASRAETATTASYVLNAISSSYSLSSSISDTSISASVALNANTASYVLNAVSASFATTASHVTGTVTSASYALSSSFSLTASFFAGTVTSASFASTASFINSLNQAVVISGSVQGNVVSASISSATSSIDFSQGSFFTSLVSGSTFFNITNPRRGQTVNLLVTTAGIATASFSSNVKQVSGSRYTPTSGSGLNDIITFISWDGTTVYLSNVKNLI